MKKFLIVLSVIAVTGFLYVAHKKNQPVLSNITVSYADSCFFPLDVSVAEKYDLSDISTLATSMFIELRYASSDNFSGKEIYPKIAKAYLRKSTAQKLMNANEEFYKLGYKIKIYDAYRPFRYQQILRNAAHEINPKTENYIADPKYGSNHNRAASVDITLTDLEGHEIPMPTEYDHFGKESAITYTGCTEEEKNNRELLGKIMENNGFKRIRSEWWHFDDTDYMSYELLDIDFVDLYN